MIIPEYVLLLISASVLISILIANRIISKERFKSKDMLSYKVFAFLASLFISYFVLEKIVRLDFYEKALTTQLQCWRDPYIKATPKHPYSVILHSNSSELVRSYHDIMAFDGIKEFPKRQSKKIENFSDIPTGTFSKNIKHYFIFNENVKDLNKGVYLYANENKSDGVMLKISDTCIDNNHTPDGIRCIRKEEYKKDVSGDYATWTYSYNHELNGFFSIRNIKASLVDKSGSIIYKRSFYTFKGSRIEDSEKTLDGWVGSSFSCES